MRLLLIAAIMMIGFGIVPETFAKERGDVKIAVGETKTVPGTKIKIKFVEVLEDSRCPEGVECIWAGNAKLKIMLSRSGKASKTVEINTSVNTEAIVYEGFKITVTDLTPKPKADTAPDRKLYRALFAAEKIAK